MAFSGLDIYKCVYEILVASIGTMSTANRCRIENSAIFRKVIWVLDWSNLYMYTLDIADAVSCVLMSRLYLYNVNQSKNMQYIYVPN